jgi:hypothetical protein
MAFSASRETRMDFPTTQGIRSRPAIPAVPARSAPFKCRDSSLDPSVRAPRAWKRCDTRPTDRSKKNEIARARNSECTRTLPSAIRMWRKRACFIAAANRLTFELPPGSRVSTTKTLGIPGWRSATRRAIAKAGSERLLKEKRTS